MTDSVEKSDFRSPKKLSCTEKNGRRSRDHIAAAMYASYTTSTVKYEVPRVFLERVHL
jgi:hypothetical protein